MTPERLKQLKFLMTRGLSPAEARQCIDHIDQQAAEIARLTKLNDDLSAGDVKEVCELREEVERKDEEITRLRTAIAEARRQAEVIAIELSNDHAKYAEQLADKLAATLAATVQPAGKGS